jgi:hypothetical protein
VETRVGHRLRVALLLSVVVLSAGLAAVPASGVAVSGTPGLPNLVPVTRWPSFDAGDESQLRFNTFIQNRGEWSFEVLGLPDEEQVRLIARQCVAWADPRLIGAARGCAEYRPIGELVWHREHNHLHLDGLATYRLYRDAAGAPGALVHDSPKVGFCLTDSYRNERYTSPVHVHPLVDPLLDDRYDLHRSQAEQWYLECRWLYGSGVPWPGMRMGISAEWQDLYNAPVPGQQFDIGAEPDGSYWIETLVNASSVVTVLETDTTDNTHWLPVCVYHDGATRKAREGLC